MKIKLQVTETFIKTMFATKELLGEDVASANREHFGMSHLLAVSFPRGNPQGVSAVN